MLELNGIAEGGVERRFDRPTGVPVVSRRFTGIVAAMVTPCRASGVVDTAETAHLCSNLASHGCNGVFIASSTGEALFLDENDRRELTVAARSALGRETLIYAGVTGLGLKQTTRYAQNAAKDGADVAVVMAPFLFRIGQPELIDYLRRIADSSPIPIALYHHYKMNTAMDVETVARVAEHENIVAIKDTNPEIQRTQALIQATAGKAFSVFQGNENLLLETLQSGGAGTVTALANFAPEAHAALYRAVKANDWSTAQENQAYILKMLELLYFPEVVESISAFASCVKLATKHRGWLENVDVMMPGYVLEESFAQKIEQHLQHHAASGHVPPKPHRGHSHPPGHTNAPQTA